MSAWLTPEQLEGAGAGRVDAVADDLARDLPDAASDARAPSSGRSPSTADTATLNATSPAPSRGGRGCAGELDEADRDVGEAVREPVGHWLEAGQVRAGREEGGRTATEEGAAGPEAEGVAGDEQLVGREPKSPGAELEGAADVEGRARLVAILARQVEDRFGERHRQLLWSVVEPRDVEWGS